MRAAAALAIVLVACSGLNLHATSAFADPAADGPAWLMVMSEEFDATGAWMPVTEEGNSCSQITADGVCQIQTECSCGGSPAVVQLAHDISVSEDWRIVFHMNKQTYCGWAFVGMAQDFNPTANHYWLAIEADGGRPSAVGKVSIRKYVDGHQTALPSTQYQFSLGQWHVWALTKTGNQFTVEFGDTEETLQTILETEDSDPVHLAANYVSLYGFNQPIPLLFDHVKVYTWDGAVPLERATWGRVKALYR